MRNCKSLGPSVAQDSTLLRSGPYRKYRSKEKEEKEEKGEKGEKGDIFLTHTSAAQLSTSNKHGGGRGVFLSFLPSRQVRAVTANEYNVRKKKKENRQTSWKNKRSCSRPNARCCKATCKGTAWKQRYNGEIFCIAKRDTQRGRNTKQNGEKIR